jgi:hypothetical protein
MAAVTSPANTSFARAGLPTYGYRRVAKRLEKSSFRWPQISHTRPMRVVPLPGTAVVSSAWMHSAANMGPERQRAASALPLPHQPSVQGLTSGD